MHIADGVLTGPMGYGVLAAGTALAAAGTAIGLRTMDYERMPRVALLSSAFFVVSAIHVPIGMVSHHLVLSGLLGLVLGWSAFPAILIALALQAVFLPGLGGVTTLGINTLIMAAPAVAMHYLFGRLTRCGSDAAAFAAAMLAGAFATFLGASILAGAVMTAGSGFQFIAKAALVFYGPLALVEGLVTASTVAFLRKVRPELLAPPILPIVHLEVSDA